MIKQDDWDKVMDSIAKIANDTTLPPMDRIRAAELILHLPISVPPASPSSKLTK